MGDDRVALALLLLLRDLRIWAESTPAERPRLLLPPTPNRSAVLAYAAENTKGIAEAVRDLSAMRTEPERLTPGILGAASRRIAQWADRRSLSWVAILFAEAAAHIDRTSSWIASEAGQAARHAGYPERADIWYDRGIMLAARNGNRQRHALIRALRGRANLLRELGKFDEARPLLDRAARLSASTRRHRIAAEIHHTLLTLAAEAGTYQEAEHHVQEALRHYPIHHPYVPTLAHDWAFVLVRHGLYREALPLLQAAHPQIRRIDYQLMSWGTLGRAAGGVGDQDLYNQASQHVHQLAERTDDYAAAAFANLAFAAGCFAEWDIGRDYATRAIAIAQSRREADVEHGARAFLSLLEERKSFILQTALPPSGRMEYIAQQFFQLLDARKRPPRRPVQLGDQETFKSSTQAAD